MSGKVHLVIPDSHCNPQWDNDRYEWLGKFIVDLKPDVIINLGDHADMASLCSYDRGKRGYEGRRYMNDVQHCRDSLDRLHGPIDKFNRARSRNKKAKYSPRWVITLGNHEHRIIRAIEEDAAHLEGIIGVEDLGFHERGYEVYDYLTPICVDGVWYCHSFVSGIMGRPIGGENHARTLLAKQHVSCTVGHSHLRDFAERTTPEGRRIQALVAGCYFAEDSDWTSGQVNSMYWRGVVVCTGVQDGEYDHEWVSLEKIRRIYGTSKGINAPLDGNRRGK